MSKPDTWIPFYFREFWEAVKGLPDYIQVGYLKAITFYWGHEHCGGLKHDSEYLRKICEIERENWDEAQAVIFDNDKFFKLDDNDRWQQKTAQETWQNMQKRYQDNVKRTESARKAKLWKARQH